MGNLPSPAPQNKKPKCKTKKNININKEKTVKTNSFFYFNNLLNHSESITHSNNKNNMKNLLILNDDMVMIGIIWGCWTRRRRWGIDLMFEIRTLIKSGFIFRVFGAFYRKEKCENDVVVKPFLSNKKYSKRNWWLFLWVWSW